MTQIKTIDIELAIFGLYDVRKHIIVPNVSDMMGLVPFETDILILTQSSYATGFEIKVSKADLLADLKKKQYTTNGIGNLKHSARQTCSYTQPLAVMLKTTVSILSILNCLFKKEFKK